ncbi:MAG: redoxin domain-containing protein [Alteromonadaceae bacterium]|nr:redoxin domain-containing protein [Alteromonadaceae bacterium]
MKNLIKSKVLNNTLVFITSMLFTLNTAAQSAVFSTEVFNNIKQQYKGQRWLALMWSVDCPPCIKELAQISKMYQQNPSLPVILINTDGDDELTEERETLIAKYQLNSLTQFYFIDGEAARSRYLIDPNWYGELPRSYFYNANGERIERSGLVSEDLLKKWLL